ncbi:MAG TPA: putative zinc-binding protein [Candidatus Bathyarchaeia archaeon]|nr:putative zinc-binding protein [Candidatus Bathyarchaeia archaeon]
MTKIAVLPCCGINKTLGLITIEIGLKLKELDHSIELISPATLSVDQQRYKEMIQESQVIVIDGCATRCATKLLEKEQYSKVKRIFIPEESKKYEISLGKALIITDEGKKLAERIAKQILEEIKNETKQVKEPIIERDFGKIDYYEVSYDKYYFRVPKEGYYFTENDCWVKPEGEKALLGITDYLQNKSSDILFVELPKIGAQVEQFDEIVNFESVKALLSLLAPVSGEVTAVNGKLEQEPNLLNDDPYEQGWAIELVLADFTEEKELLMDGKNYFAYMKKKIEEEH